MFEDLLRSQRLQRSHNSRARQIIVSQIETQIPPESRSTIELKVIVDDHHSISKIGDNSILQSNHEGQTLLPGLIASHYVKPPGTDIPNKFKPYYSNFLLISPMKEKEQNDDFIPAEDLSTFGKNWAKNLNRQNEILLLLSLLILFS